MNPIAVMKADPVPPTMNLRIPAGGPSKNNKKNKATEKSLSQQRPPRQPTPTELPEPPQPTRTKNPTRMMMTAMSTSPALTRLKHTNRMTQEALSFHDDVSEETAAADHDTTTGDNPDTGTQPAPTFSSSAATDIDDNPADSSANNIIFSDIMSAQASVTNDHSATNEENSSKPTEYPAESKYAIDHQSATKPTVYPEHFGTPEAKADFKGHTNAQDISALPTLPTNENADTNVHLPFDPESASSSEDTNNTPTDSDTDVLDKFALVKAQCLAEITPTATTTDSYYDANSSSSTSEHDPQPEDSTKAKPTINNLRDFAAFQLNVSSVLKNAEARLKAMHYHYNHSEDTDDSESTESTDTTVYSTYSAKELDVLRSERDKLQAEVASTHAALANASAIVPQLHQRLADQEADTASYKEQLRLFKQDHAELLDRERWLQEVLSQEKTQKSTAYEKISFLEAQLKNADEHSKAFKKQVDVRQENIHQLHQQLTKSQDHMDQLCQQLNESQDHMNQLYQELNESQDQLHTIHQERLRATSEQQEADREAEAVAESKRKIHEAKITAAHTALIDRLHAQYKNAIVEAVKSERERCEGLAEEAAHTTALTIEKLERKITTLNESIASDQALLAAMENANATLVDTLNKVMQRDRSSNAVPAHDDSKADIKGSESPLSHIFGNYGTPESKDPEAKAADDFMDHESTSRNIQTITPERKSSYKECAGALALEEAASLLGLDINELTSLRQYLEANPMDTAYDIQQDRNILNYFGITTPDSTKSLVSTVSAWRKLEINDDSLNTLAREYLLHESSVHLTHREVTSTAQAFMTQLEEICKAQYKAHDHLKLTAQIQDTLLDIQLKVKFIKRAHVLTTAIEEIVLISFNESNFQDMKQHLLSLAMAPTSPRSDTDARQPGASEYNRGGSRTENPRNQHAYSATATNNYYSRHSSESTSGLGRQDPHALVVSNSYTPRIGHRNSSNLTCVNRCAAGPGPGGDPDDDGNGNGDGDSNNRPWVNRFAAGKITKLLEDIDFGEPSLNVNPTPMSQAIEASRAIDHLNNLTEREVKVLRNFNKVVGSLIYLSTTVRPDITTIVKYSAGGLPSPTMLHICLIDYLLVYLYHTRTYGLRYTHSDSAVITEVLHPLS